VKKLKSLGLDGDAYDESNRKALEEVEKKLTPEEQSILKTLKGRRMVRPEDSLNIDNFTLDSIDGLAPCLERGRLGLTPAKKASVKFTTHDPLSFLNGEARAGKNRAMQNGHVATNGSGAMNGHNETNGHSSMNGHSKVEGVSVKPSMAELMEAEDDQPSPPLDEATRHRLMTSLRESAEELETPYDTMLRVLNAVSLPHNIPQKSCSHHCLLTVHLPTENRVG